MFCHSDNSPLRNETVYLRVDINDEETHLSFLTDENGEAHFSLDTTGWNSTLVSLKVSISHRKKEDKEEGRLRKGLESGRNLRFRSTVLWLLISFDYICRSIFNFSPVPSPQGSQRLCCNSSAKWSPKVLCCPELERDPNLLDPPQLPLTPLKTSVNLNTSSEEISPFSTLGHVGGGSAELAVDTCLC